MYTELSRFYLIGLNLDDVSLPHQVGPIKILNILNNPKNAKNNDHTMLKRVFTETSIHMMSCNFIKQFKVSGLQLHEMIKCLVFRGGPNHWSILIFFPKTIFLL